MKIIQDWSKESVKDINKEAGMNRGTDVSKDGGEEEEMAAKMERRR